MIIALTMNPSIDISYPLEKLLIDSVNRVDKVRKTAGGKGLNVARVVKLSQNDVIATGLLGGDLGNYIRTELDKDHIPHQFSPIAEESRNCIAILHDGAQTEILESGPTISVQEQLTFKQDFTSLINSTDVITISGSLPKGIAHDYYAQLITIANKQQKKVLLDCSGEALLCALSGNDQPYLIKPNHEELSFLVGKTVSADDLDQIVDIINHRKELQRVPVIVVSLGKNGALAKINNQVWRVVIPKITVVNPVGSGDATLAGLAVGVSQNDAVDILLKRAMVFGMLNAQQATTGMINLDHYDELFEQVEVSLY